ncbi:MAG: hypothetical protein WCS15_07640 [Prevotella sp.]
MSTKKVIKNINDWKLVDEREEYEYRYYGFTSWMVKRRPKRFYTWQITLDDGAAKPSSPANPGSYSLPCRCEDRGVSDPYGTVLQRVYHETWVTTGSWEEVKE